MGIGSGRCWFCDEPGSVAPSDRGRFPELCPRSACRAGWERLCAWTGFAEGPVLATHIVVGNEWMPLPAEPARVAPPHVELEEAIAPPASARPTVPRPLPKPGFWLRGKLARRPL